MAYADTAKRIILESWGRFEATVGAAVEKGDLLGYNSGWVLADANAGVPAKAIALRAAASAETNVPMARGAIVEGPTGATPGGAMYASDTAGDTTQTVSTTSEQKVGVAISATRILLEPDQFQQKMTITYPFAAADVAKVFFIAPFRCRVTKIIEVHGVVAGQAGTLTVERLQGTEAVSNGDDLLGTTKLNLESTINTPVEATLTDTVASLVLERTNRLALKVAAGAATSLANAVMTVEIERA